MRNYILYMIFALFVPLIFSFGIKQDIGATEIFMDINYKGIKLLYDKPQGHIIKRMKHDLEGEDFVTFIIIDRNDSMFHVKAYYSIKGFISKGWIKKDKYLGIYSRAYDQNLKVYQNPNKTSQIICQEGYNPKMYNVIDSYGRWLKIRVITKGKVFEGWIPPEMQCANVYSTCN
jgi:hypothetical protein